LAGLVGFVRSGVPGVVGQAAGSRLHSLDGREHLPPHVRVRSRGRAGYGCARRDVEDPRAANADQLDVGGDAAPVLLADAEPKDGGVSRPRAADRFQGYPREPWGREADAVAEQHRQYIHEDLVDEPPPQALAGHVGTEDLQVLAARSVQRRGDRFPDVTGEVCDLRVRRLRR
jgi:hypothetical protein